MKRGWFSAEQARRCGSFVWSRPDGTEVIVSSVGEAPHFADVRDRGDVVEFLRRFSKGEQWEQWEQWR